MKILGVDPGCNVTGYGVISESADGMICHGWGAARAKKCDPMSVRLKNIADCLREIVAQHQPECLAMEDIFFAKNAQSALKLGMARGAVMLVAGDAGIPVAEYSPLLVKQSVVGYGRADKEQVRAMVKQILSLKKAPAPLDASDALAVAITHAGHRVMLDRISR